MKLSQNSETESTNKDSTLMNLMNKGEVWVKAEGVAGSKTKHKIPNWDL